MFKCWLSQEVTKKRNSTLQYAYEDGTPCDIVIKEPSSIVTPTIEIHGTPNSFGGRAYPDFTLAYIPEFKRYYFVRDIRNLSASQWELDLEEDVLATYKEEILNTKAYIQYAQRGYNDYVADPRFPNYVYGKEVMIEKAIPFIDDAIDGIDYVSGTGSVTFGVFTGTSGVVTSFASSMTYYSVRADEIGELSAWLQEHGTELASEFANPLDLLTNAIWMPFRIPAKGSYSNVVIGGIPTNTRGIILNEQNVTEQGGFTISIPYWKGKDDIEEAPYLQKMGTETTLYLPGVGSVNIEGLVGLVEEWASDEKNKAIDIDYVIDWMTGEVTYLLSATPLTRTSSVTYKGSLGVPITMAWSGANAWGILQSGVNMFTGVATEIMGFALDNPYMMAIGAANAVNSMVPMIQSGSQRTIQQNGGSGSFAMLSGLVKKARINRTYYPVTENHGNCANIIGAPVFKCAKLGNYSGYIKCTNCYPEIKCTQLEWEMLDALINGQGTIMSGAKQGGIYIE